MAAANEPEKPATKSIVRRTGEVTSTIRKKVAGRRCPSPVDFIAPIHDRMPFILRDDQLDLWLSKLPISAFSLQPLTFWIVIPSAAK
jgi:hypothetical protein